MKRSIFIGLILLLGDAYLHGQGIKFFEGTFDQAKAEAKKQNKYLFVDCYSKYCGPCHEMERDVFPKQEVGDYYNAHFICLKYDIDHEQYGKKLAETYHVSAVPSYLYLDADGKVVNRIEATRRAKQFIASAKETFDEQNNLIGLIKRFEGGEHDTAFLIKFIDATAKVDQPECEKALALYWDAIPMEDLWKTPVCARFMNAEKDIHSKPYKYLYAHYDQYLETYVKHWDFSVYGEMAEVARESMIDQLYSKAAQAITKAADDHDSNLFNEAKRIAFMSKFREPKYEACIFEIKYYKWTGHWDTFFQDADNFLGQYAKDSEYYLYTNFVNQILDNRVQDIRVLNIAVSYAETAISHGKASDNLDPYARVLYMLKRYPEAAKAAAEAIELAKQEKEDYQNTAELLEDINKSMKGKD